MRIVPTPMPVRSATSEMANPSTIPADATPQVGAGFNGDAGKRRDVARSILLTGASGYVGGRLAPVLAERGHRLRCLMRAPDPARVPAGAEAVRGDALSGEGLAAALDGVDVA